MQKSTAPHLAPIVVKTPCSKIAQRCFYCGELQRKAGCEQELSENVLLQIIFCLKLNEIRHLIKFNTKNRG